MCPQEAEVWARAGGERVIPFRKGNDKGNIILKRT